MGKSMIIDRKSGAFSEIKISKKCGVLGWENLIFGILREQSVHEFTS